MHALAEALPDCKGTGRGRCADGRCRSRTVHVGYQRWPREVEETGGNRSRGSLITITAAEMCVNSKDARLMV